LLAGEIAYMLTCASFVNHPSLREAPHMSHAVVINVNLPVDGTPEEGLKMLNEMVIPQARSQEGFQNGTWMNDHGKGMGVVVFDTEEHADAAQKNLRPPVGIPTTFVSSSVYEVGAQAHA
jgi:hypothetical protein